MYSLSKTKVAGLDQIVIANHQTLLSFVNNKLGARVSIFIENTKYELSGLRNGFEVYKFN